MATRTIFFASAIPTTAFYDVTDRSIAGYNQSCANDLCYHDKPLFLCLAVACFYAKQVFSMIFFSRFKESVKEVSQYQNC